MQSHPSWVRGLKHWCDSYFKQLTSVAPLVGAWIETPSALDVTDLLLVAPLVGAWIETLAEKDKKAREELSHPSWVRGLKPYPFGQESEDNPVAPLVGAWIETADTEYNDHRELVAPLVGAWIETCCNNA